MKELALWQYTPMDMSAHGIYRKGHRHGPLGLWYLLQILEENKNKPVDALIQEAVKDEELVRGLI